MISMSYSASTRAVTSPLSLEEHRGASISHQPGARPSNSDHAVGAVRTGAEILANAGLKVPERRNRVAPEELRLAVLDRAVRDLAFGLDPGLVVVLAVPGIAHPRGAASGPFCARYSSRSVQARRPSAAFPCAWAESGRYAGGEARRKSMALPHDRISRIVGDADHAEHARPSCDRGNGSGTPSRRAHRR